MSIAFENDKDVIIAALEKIIAFTRNHGHVFLAQCVWSLASLIGLEQQLVNYIDTMQFRVKVTVSSEDLLEARVTKDKEPEKKKSSNHDTVLKDCEEFLRDSRRLQDLATLKATGRTQTGRINPTPSTKQVHKVSKRKAAKPHPLTEGIEEQEIQRRKQAGECLLCAWPPDKKGAHRVKTCNRPIKLDKGTASYPRAKAYVQAKILEETSEPDTSGSSEEEEEEEEEEDN